MIDSSPMKPTETRLAVIAAACALALGGCGGDGGESASDTVQSYVDARNHRDFQQVCDLLSDQLRQQTGGSNCPRFIDEQTSGSPRRQLKVIGVTENGDRAVAHLQTTGESGNPIDLTVMLAKQDGDWRVTSFGGGPSD
jgi:hypothetical protein